MPAEWRQEDLGSARRVRRAFKKGDAMGLRVGAHCILVNSGHYLDLEDPKPQHINLFDIALGLSRMCRFSGQGNHFYSVAEHSVHCAMQAHRDGHPLDVQCAVLMHDAAEAYVGDVTRPLKSLLTGYDSIEKNLMDAVAYKFHLRFKEHQAIIDEIDKSMLFHERRYLFGNDGRDWEGQDKARQMDVTFHAWRPEEAAVKFIDVCKSLRLL